ncbi:MAG: phosphotransferase [Candidatus Thorarchaeota archaeon]|nr:phosphotransferase [Candidatus Thorarchaeota archaeon]
MSSGEQVSYRSFLLRLRNLAKKALDQYGLKGMNPKFKGYSGNGLYQVDVPLARKSEGSIPPGRYALRLHQPNYMKPEYISSEMEWLSALRRANISVPAPFRNSEGNWLTVVEGEHTPPAHRNCTLLSWVEGREIMKGVRPKHYKSLGRVVGKMHEQSMHWRKPEGFARPHWDWEGLYGDGFDYGFSAIEAREAIPKKYQDEFTDVLNRVDEAAGQLGKGKKAYGLIHADLGNVVYHRGEARPFDFDDCGFSYWMFDLGAVIADYMYERDGRNPKIREALIEGYLETSPLAESDLGYLDLFVAARFAQFMFFYQGNIVKYPHYREEGEKDVAECAKYLKSTLRKLK